MSPKLFLFFFRRPGVLGPGVGLKLVLGPGDGLKHYEIMKFGVAGLKNNEIGILLYQNEADENKKAIKSII